MFHLRPPPDAQILRTLEGLRDAPYSYAHVGLTKQPLAQAPAGFHLDDYGAEIGRGPEAFARAKDALTRLENYPPSFTRIVRQPGLPTPGWMFATVARHYGFASVHPCRVIYVVDEPHRYGLGFGTLPGHAERGEERFLVSLIDDVVRYDVCAFSKPRGLARLGAPIARGLQRRFQRETVRTMKAIGAA